MGRRVVMLAVVAMLLAGGPARAQSLAGETTMSSPRAAVASVHLDKALKFDEDKLPKAKLEGQGGWRELALIGSGAFLVAASFDDGSFIGTSDDFPAGDYRLYLATDDGVPLNATLMLPGLDGQVSLSPSALLSVHRLTPAPYASASTPQTSVVGALSPTRGGGMGVTSLDIDYPSPSGGRTQRCVYADEQLPHGQDPFDVGCPGGFDDEFFPGGYGSPFLAAIDTADGSRTYWFTQSGVFGTGANVTASGAPALKESARWLDFGDPGEPVAAPPAPEQAVAPPAAEPARAPAVAARALPCPRAALRLPRAFRAGAARAALHGRHGLQAIAGRAGGADRSRIAGACGRDAASRTAVVALRGRGTIETAYASRDHHGWHVWWSERRQLSRGH